LLRYFALKRILPENQKERKELKDKIIKIIIVLLFIIVLTIVIFKIAKKQDVVLQTSSLNKYDKIKTDNPKIIKSEFKQKVKKLTDTIVVLFFKDLSKVYNYKIIDKYYSVKNQNNYDSVLRIIEIFNKKDSLVQKVYPNLKMTPWYFLELNYPLRLSRSFITGKNANYCDTDNYCGEIVVADLNFDGLEDFATPINSGADNGPHYAFYIQNKNTGFEYNNYLTENLTWFPGKINDSLMSFTTSVPFTVYDMQYQTFKYDAI
jgi:hypothetical protein